MKKKIGFYLRLLFFQIQKALLLSSYFLTKPFVKKVAGLWIVGVDEIAAFIHNVAGMLPISLSVSFSENRYYEYQYTYQIKKAWLNSYALTRLLYGPILLGYLVNKSEGFFYIWDTGFLTNILDGRAFEFSFIRKRKRHLVCMFIGNDIRSQKLSLEYATKNKIDTLATYYSMIVTDALDEVYEKHKRMIANSADTYADLIFNAPVDQLSYLKRGVLPIFYVYPDKDFVRNDLKFSKFEKIKIVHAPSSPILKGTQLVRAAIKKLEMEGFVFEYIELIGVSNALVIQTLRTSHIVLNEFYAFVPGQFGIEAMSAHCALLTSADREIETTLPDDSDGAWLPTQYWEVYDNLKYLLENNFLIKKYADEGFEWAQKHWAYSRVQKKLLSLFDNEGLKI